MAENYYENCWFFICRLQITMYGSEWSLVLFRMKLGFVQNEAWFCSKWSLVFVRMKLHFYSRETSDSWEACHELATGLSWTRGKLPTKPNNEYINWRGTYFFKNKIVYLIFRYFDSFFLCFYFLSDNNKI